MISFLSDSERGEMASGNSSTRLETACKQMSQGSDWAMMGMLIMVNSVAQVVCVSHFAGLAMAEDAPDLATLWKEGAKGQLSPLQQVRVW